MDVGSQYENKFMKKKKVEDTLWRVSPEIRAFVGKISSYLVQGRLKDKITHFSAEVRSKDGFSNSSYPGPANDNCTRLNSVINTEGKPVTCAVTVRTKIMTCAS